MRSTLQQRFWEKVNKTEGCWNWIGKINKYGYGKIWFEKKERFSHRISYLFKNGSFDESLFVLHKCDNRRCVNPDHLFLGTQADNMRDMCAKKRHWSPKNFKGEKNPFFGKSHTQEVKNCLANKFAKHFQITKPDGAIIELSNLRKFARENNLNIGQLSMLRRGKTKTCKGYTNLIMKSL